MIIQRRSFITGLVSMIAAPAIVRIDSLMPVRSAPKIVKVLWSRQIVTPKYLTGGLIKIDILYDMYVRPEWTNFIGEINDQINSTFKSS